MHKYGSRRLIRLVRNRTVYEFAETEGQARSRAGGARSGRATVAYSPGWQRGWTLELHCHWAVDIAGIIAGRSRGARARALAEYGGLVDFGSFVWTVTPPNRTTHSVGRTRAAQHDPRLSLAGCRAHSPTCDEPPSPTAHADRPEWAESVLSDSDTRVLYGNRNRTAEQGGVVVESTPSRSRRCLNPSSCHHSLSYLCKAHFP